MKIIDLLNKIANGEKVPERIMYKYKIYEYDEDFQEYYVSNNEELFGTLFHKNTTLQFINDEVEILDELKEDKIQKIYHCETSLIQNEVEIFITKNLNLMVSKINELIDEVNKLKESDK